MVQWNTQVNKGDVMSKGLKKLFATAITDIKSTDVEGVGVLRYESNGKVYRWVKNRNATAIAAKQPVCYDAGNAGSTAIFEAVNMPVTADLMLLAGCAVAALGISGAKCFGWVCVQGYFTNAAILDTSGTALAIGDELVAANSLATLTYATAVGTAPKRRQTIVAMETSSGASADALSKDVYINCL